MATHNILGLLEQSELDAIYVDDDQLAGIYSELGDLYRRDPKTFRRLSEKVVNAHRRKGGYVMQKAPFDERNLTGKALFEKRLHLLPKDIRDKLAKGLLTISDQAYYSVRKITGDHIEMFLSSDAERKGVINLNRAMLPADTVMLVTSIMLLSAPAKDGTNDIPMEKANFSVIGSEIANGWFIFSAGQQILFDKMSNEVFAHGDMDNVRAGEYVLDAPKIIMPQQEITFNIEVGSIPADTYVKAVLKGVVTVKA